MRIARMLSWAAACGMGAFTWALVTRAPAETAEERARSLRAADWPHDPERLAKWVVKHPASMGAWEELARRRRGSGDGAGALDAWKKAAEIGVKIVAHQPRDADLAYELGVCAHEAGDTATAETALRKAAFLYTEQTGTPWEAGATHLRNLGWCRYWTGDETGAMEAWTRAAAVQTDVTDGSPSAGGLYNLACFRGLAGDREGALEALDRAAEGGWRDRVWAAQDEDFFRIRDDARFATILQKMSRPTDVARTHQAAPEDSPHVVDESGTGG